MLSYRIKWPISSKKSNDCLMVSSVCNSLWATARYPFLNERVLLDVVSIALKPVK